MCFNTESSLLAWGISMLCVVFLLLRANYADVWISSFIVSFALIQLWEANIWKDISNKDNEFYTKLILLTLIIQPLVQTVAGYMTIKNEEKNKLLYLIIPLGLVLIYTIYRISSSQKGQFYTSVGEKGHLIWNDRSSNVFLGNYFIVALYLLGLFIPLLFLENKGIALLSVGILTALYSMFIAGSKEFGSYWCYTAIAYSLIAVFYF